MSKQSVEIVRLPGGFAWATVIVEMSISLDAFVADPVHRVGPLFDWYR